MFRSVDAVTIKCHFNIIFFSNRYSAAFAAIAVHPLIESYFMLVVIVN